MSSKVRTPSNLKYCIYFVCYVPLRFRSLKKTRSDFCTQCVKPDYLHTVLIRYYDRLIIALSLVTVLKYSKQLKNDFNFIMSSWMLWLQCFCILNILWHQVKFTSIWWALYSNFTCTRLQIKQVYFCRRTIYCYSFLWSRSSLANYRNYFHRTSYFNG